ncbi:hypothetical protein [Paenibacillus sp. URB8-2]|uniref:hypothetical protein n=1 Tax=Paenibacillus sp. URB8-2 TaxID=2741301 RepID=UPI0015BC8DAE|nr:hypothetical protein [Paenibacillus sp. URB8-2]BCG57458.1 hypothetical protein PUR_08830 [Paenibacillus sp. URB8-2]
MSKVTKLAEVIDFCANPKCQAEIMFGQRVVRHGKDLYCGNNCLCEGIGAVVIKADDSPERGDASENEKDDSQAPTP